MSTDEAFRNRVLLVIETRDLEINQYLIQSDDVASHGQGPATDGDLPGGQLPRGDGGGGGGGDHHQPRHPGPPGNHQRDRGRRERGPGGQRGLQRGHSCHRCGALDLLS